MKLATKSEFLSAFAENVNSLRGSLYSETIKMAKFDDVKSDIKCVFTQEGKQYRVDIETNYGPLTAYSKSDKPKFIAIVRCPVDSKYVIKDDNGDTIKEGTIEAGKMKLTFY